MSSIRPQQLTDEELLRHIYIMGFDKLPVDWIKELCERLAKRIDNK